MPATRQLGLLSMLGLWAFLCFAGGLYASWHGYGGLGFAAVLPVLLFYFGVMLVFAARGVPEFLGAVVGARSAYLLGAATFLVYLVYALGTGSFACRPPRGFRRHCCCPNSAGRYRSTPAAGSLAGLPYACRHLAHCEISLLTLGNDHFTIAMALAVSERATRLRLHRIALPECRACRFCAHPKNSRHRL